MTKKKLFTVFGTRPEAIKFAPFLHEVYRHREKYDVVVCVTAQHREMLDDVLKVFKIRPHYDLDCMIPGQDLFHTTAYSLNKLNSVLETEKPDMVVVQGDTTSTFVGALGAYYKKIPVAHLEAGLRTGNKYSPFPEEKNRQLVSCLADLHFAPTTRAKSNLLREGVKEQDIFVVGNTVIDALLAMKQNLSTKTSSDFHYLFSKINWSKKILLVTGHRRENFGEGLQNICYALKNIVNQNQDVEVVYAVHFNPNVREPVYKIIGEQSRIHLLPALSYEPFVYLMDKSHFVLTDSGGIQEEAPSLGKPVLVMREQTERPEAIEAGTAKIVGTDPERIFQAAQDLLTNKESYQKMSQALNPYGDGKSSQRILNVITRFLHES